MSWLGNVLGFEKFHGKQILKDIAHKPTRLLTGVDPASTKVWNKVLGTNDKPIVDQMGGATQDRYRQADAAGIDYHDAKGMQNVAHVVAALYGTQGLAGIGGAGAGAGGGAAGGGAAGGAVEGGAAGGGAAGGGAGAGAGMDWGSLGGMMNQSGQQGLQQQAQAKPSKLAEATAQANALRGQQGGQQIGMINPNAPRKEY